MAHKTLIGGTAYGINGGKGLVNGTGYSITNGRALVGGTGYNVPLSSKATVKVKGNWSGSHGSGMYPSIKIDGAVRGTSSGDNAVIEYQFEKGTVAEIWTMWYDISLNGRLVWENEDDGVGYYSYTITKNVTIQSSPGKITITEG